MDNLTSKNSLRYTEIIFATDQVVPVSLLGDGSSMLNKLGDNASFEVIDKSQK